MRTDLEGAQAPAKPAPDPAAMERALRFLADELNWIGDPHESWSVLTGPDTAYELAVDVLGLEGH